MNKDEVELSHCGIEHRTEKAMLVDFGDRKEWLPLSQVEYEDSEVVRIPEWLAKEKGLWE